jgi:hypothetical protein
MPAKKTAAATDSSTCLARPARRALASAGIAHLRDFGRFTESEVMALHGRGPNALGKIRAAMKAARVSFRK